jgi:hypothetical protein
MPRFLRDSCSPAVCGTAYLCSAEQYSLTVYLYLLLVDSSYQQFVGQTFRFAKQQAIPQVAGLPRPDGLAMTIYLSHCEHFSYVSKIIVTGPSFIISTTICAANLPVFIFSGGIKVLSLSTKLLYICNAK